jgi:hypothetical protein
LGMERQFTTVPTCVANGFNLSWSIWYLFPNTNQLLVESPMFIGSHQSFGLLEPLVLLGANTLSAFQT